MRGQYSPKCMPPTATWMRRLSVLTTCSCGTHCGHLQRVVSDVYWLPGITLQRCDQYYYKCDWSVRHINAHYLNGDMDIAWIHCVIIVHQHHITEEIHHRDDMRGYVVGVCAAKYLLTFLRFSRESHVCSTLAFKNALTAEQITCISCDGNELLDTFSYELFRLRMSWPWWRVNTLTRRYW